MHHLAHFVDCLHSGEAFSPDFADGMKVQAVLEAAQQSANDGKWAKVKA